MGKSYRRNDTDNQQPLRTIDARTPESKATGLENVEHDMSGNITGGIDPQTGLRKKVPGSAPTAASVALANAPSAAQHLASAPSRPPTIPTFSTTPQVIAGTPAAAGAAVRQASQFPAPPGAAPATASSRHWWQDAGYSKDPGMSYAPDSVRHAMPASPFPAPPVYGKISQETTPTSHYVAPGETAYMNGQPVATGTTVTPMPSQYGGGVAQAFTPPKPTLDAAAQKGIVAQYPEIGQAGSWANTNFLAGLKQGANTAEDANKAYASLFPKPPTPASPLALASPTVDVPTLNQPTPGKPTALPARIADVPAQNFGLASGAPTAAPAKPLLPSAPQWQAESTITTQDIAKPAPTAPGVSGLLSGFGSSGGAAGIPQTPMDRPQTPSAPPKIPDFNSGNFQQKLGEMNNFNASPKTASSFPAPPTSAPAETEEQRQKRLAGL
jgi:hypothetical protein